MPHRTQTNWSVRNNFYRKKQIGGATQRREVEAVLKRGTKQSVLHCTHKKNFAVLFTFYGCPGGFKKNVKENNKVVYNEVEGEREKEVNDNGA